MSTDLVATGNYAPPVSIASMRERQGFIQAFIREAMLEGVHYMVIPGTTERSLTKQGSEFLLSAFQIAVEPKITETVGPDFVRVLVELKGTHMSTGAFVGVGVGRCSSNEEKYKWRKAVCREEWLETPEDRRRVAYKNAKSGGFYKIEQVRAGHEDIANTVLKMAKKRAQADLCLTALAASDAFKTQKAPPRSVPTKEDLQRETRRPPAENSKPNPENSKPNPETKNATTATNGTPGATDAPRPATSAQLGLLKRKLDQSGIPETHFLAEFEIGVIEELPFDQVDKALKWIADLVEPQ